MDATVLVVVWLALAILAGFIAAQKGRGVVGWVVCALLLSSLVALVALAVAPDLRRKCPFCRMSVPDDAIMCGHCARDMSATI